MAVFNALRRTVWITLLLRVVVADDACEPTCPDPFPPGHRHIGDAWWAIGDEASGAYIAQLTTDLVVPQKPDGIEGLRILNPALDNTVSA